MATATLSQLDVLEAESIHILREVVSESARPAMLYSIGKDSSVMLEGAKVLASRQEYKLGEWLRFEGKEFSIRATGSVAYKLALVSVSLADATWTLSPKHEWDVAAGVALAHSAECRVCCTQNATLQFNQDKTLLPGLVASNEGIWGQVLQLVSQEVSA